MQVQTVLAASHERPNQLAECVLAVCVCAAAAVARMRDEYETRINKIVKQKRMKRGLMLLFSFRIYAKPSCVPMCRRHRRRPYVVRTLNKLTKMSNSADVDCESRQMKIAICISDYLDAIGDHSPGYTGCRIHTKISIIAYRFNFKPSQIAMNVTRAAHNMRITSIYQY